ncbi:unnamed protein product [Rotaria magnacalcarata]|uniref:FLYWCH-type domain-containing protein n=1 Tax=Rotaria magnacalcarata TaxID=392030 RepID=A0A8S2MA68_9BILA|nr:unnamed protein product [Rotaria magnacalcarata]
MPYFVLNIAMSNTPTITFSQNNKGKRVFVCDGYVYHLSKSYSKFKYWPCENRLCAAVIHTDINDQFKVRKVTEATPIGRIYDEELAKAQLSQTALNDANVRNFCRRLMALLLLPLHEVEFAFEELNEQRPDVLAPLFVYFDNYWMKQICLTLWNVSDLKTWTNNNCEGEISLLSVFNGSIPLEFRLAQSLQSSCR